MSEHRAGSEDRKVQNRTIKHITGFVRRLRYEGADVPANAAIDAVRGVSTVGLENKDRTRHALRATLIARKRDIDTFERLFPDFWEHLMKDLDLPQGSKQLEILEEDSLVEIGNRQDTKESDGDRDPEASIPDPTAESDTEEAPQTTQGETPPAGGAPSGDDEGDVGQSVTSSTYSPVGQPQTIDIEGIDEDKDRLQEYINELTKVIGNLKGRRWESTPKGNQVDIRQAMRQSFGSGGTIPDIPLQSRQESVVQGVILVDVSQSVLDTIDRGFLIRFLDTMHDTWRNVRIFFFDTDVREVTDRFAAQSATDALVALREAEAEWGGGTRIGHALATIREEYPFAIDRETTVFVISDGLEVDEIDRLKSEMAQITKRSNLTFWLNQLAASEDYKPTCRGMEAVLPYIDALFAFAEEEDVKEMARQLRLRGAGGSIGYQYDQRDRAT